MARRKAAKEVAGEKLTEHEGMLLALLVREQPATAYQLYRIFEQSPISSINTSKGQLYPAIRRLRERRLVEAARVSGDRRNAEQLTVTKEGLSAVRKWVKNIEPAHVILDDPLRTRTLSLDLLSREERLEWVANAKGLVKSKRDVIDEYNQSVSIPYQRTAYHSVVESLRAKMNWLDELLYVVASGK